MGRCSPGRPGPCMTNGRGPPCVGGTGGLMGMGPGRGIPWGGREPGGLVDPDGGVHLVGSGGVDFFSGGFGGGGVSGWGGGGHFLGGGGECGVLGCGVGGGGGVGCLAGVAGGG